MLNLLKVIRFLAMLLCIQSFAIAQDIPPPESCHEHQSSSIRLYCYDAVTGYLKGRAALDRSQRRAVADLAWASAAEKHCPFMKLNQDVLIDLATEHALGPDTMREGGELAELFEQRFGMLELVLTQDEQGAFCLVALLLFGSDGAAIPNLLIDD